MTALPSNLGLTNIADGAPVIAADHRNNYSALQAYANAMNGLLSAGVAGQMLRGVGTDLTWVYPPGFELGYDQITASVNVVSTTEATPTTIISGTSRTYEAAAYIFEFACYEIVTPSTTGGNVIIDLIQDGTRVARLANITNPVTPNQAAGAVGGKFRFTPSAGAHTFDVAAFASSTTGTPSVQAGGGSTIPPAFLRVTKV